MIVYGIARNNVFDIPNKLYEAWLLQHNSLGFPLFLQEFPLLTLLSPWQFLQLLSFSNLSECRLMVFGCYQKDSAFKFP